MNIMSEVVALAFTKDNPLTWEQFSAFFVERGYEVEDEDNGLFSSTTKEPFKGVFYTDAGYVLIEAQKNSEEGLLPDEIFDFLLSIDDSNALISIGDDEGYGVEIHTEMNLGKFQKDFRKAQEEQE
tara:strand:- start:1165 stop:1542 length:378 start_codon:yes stop_codon:yes gene_type:complete